MQFFPSFFILAINKGDTSLRHRVLVPVSLLSVILYQQAKHNHFKHSLHMQGLPEGEGLVVGEPRKGKGNFTHL